MYLFMRVLVIYRQTEEELSLFMMGAELQAGTIWEVARVLPSFLRPPFVIQYVTKPWQLNANQWLHKVQKQSWSPPHSYFLIERKCIFYFFLLLLQLPPPSWLTSEMTRKQLSRFIGAFHPVISKKFRSARINLWPQTTGENSHCKCEKIPINYNCSWLLNASNRTT